MKEKEPISALERLAIRMTESVGSVKSLIIHTVLFVLVFALYFFHVTLENILLILTTVLSLEAIYLAIFIQMTVNRNTQSLEAVEEDIDEIQDDVQEIEQDIDEIQVDVDEMHDEVEGLEKDIDEIQEDMDEDDLGEKQDRASLTSIQSSLEKIVAEIAELKKNRG